MSHVTNVAVLFAIFAVYTAQGYQQDALNLHNSYRSLHQSPWMYLDYTLNQNALKCAKYYASKGRIDTCPYKGKVGENVFYARGMLFSPAPSKAAKQAVKSWYDEVKNYNFKRPGTSVGIIDHFTQLVWKSSNRLGVGVYTQKSSRTTYVVALYAARGNVRSIFGGGYNLYKQNVLP